MNRDTNITFLTGAGISAESGIPTFRDENGLWKHFDADRLASAEGWKNNPQEVLDFYNERRRKLKEVEPNDAHRAITELQNHFNNVHVITQNVDDLHERAGNKNILHVHGQLLRVRGQAFFESKYDGTKIYYTYDVDYDHETKLGDICKGGSQLRPDIVFFGEMTYNVNKVDEILSNTDIFIMVGSSLALSSVTSWLFSLPKESEKYFLTLKKPEITSMNYLGFNNELIQITLPEMKYIEGKATETVTNLVNNLIERLNK